MHCALQNVMLHGVLCYICFNEGLFAGSLLGNDLLVKGLHRVPKGWKSSNGCFCLEGAGESFVQRLLVCVCVRVRVRACVRACVRVCVLPLSRFNRLIGILSFTRAH